MHRPRAARQRWLYHPYRASKPMPPHPPKIERAKILITVKTYPQLSARHTETVCTAGLREGRRWIRLYPIAFRYLEKEQQFRKYQWVEAHITRDTRDPRPESYKLTGNIKPLGFLDTQDEWELRKRHVLSKVYHNLETLIDEARDTKIFTSLAVFKPHRILDFSMRRDTSTNAARDRKQKMLAKQLPEEKARHLVHTVPYKFYYTFEDQLGKRSTLQILDWEIYQLCRKLIHKYGTRKRSIYPHLRKKYLDQFIATRDLFFFLGTNKYWHIRRSNNPFMIVGIFYPPK
jgi:hypothetical protein